MDVNIRCEIGYVMLYCVVLRCLGERVGIWGWEICREE